MASRKRDGKFRGPKLPHKRFSKSKPATTTTYPTSKLHLDFKQVMLGAGIEGFETEYRVSYYQIDEAHPELKLALEIDGCYWHGCSLCGHRPKRRVKNNDVRKNYKLAQMGWYVLRIRSCLIKSDLGACLDRIRRAMVAILEGGIQSVLDEDRGGFVKKSDEGKSTGPSLLSVKQKSPL